LTRIAWTFGFGRRVLPANRNVPGGNESVFADWQKLMRVSLACCLYVAGPAAAITSSEYLPLQDGNSWTYQANGFWTWTSTVLPGTTLVNGVQTKAVRDSDDGYTAYYTSDSNGIREHRGYDPEPPAVTTTWSPPLTYMRGIAAIGDVVNLSGTVSFSMPDESPLPFVFSYTASSRLEAVETITVPAGTFETVRVATTVHVFGTSQGIAYDESPEWTAWFARRIGKIEEMYSDSDGTFMTVLLSTNVMPPAFKDDIVVDFGGIGLWARMNDASWLKLNNYSPDQVVVGDVDGNGTDDVIAYFSGFGGIFVKHNLGGWSQFSTLTPEAMAVGDLDANGQDDVVIDFGSIGLWARMNDASWLKLSNTSPDQLVVGDVDGNGQDDVIAYFSGFGGIFVKRNLGGWSQFSTLIPELMAVGDLDGNGQDDVVIDFGAIGLWARMNDASWLKLHNSSPALIATGDVDGSGADDVLATFAGLGFWQKLNLGGWSVLSSSAPDQVVTGDINGSGKEDVIADFGSTIGGIFVKRDQGAWVKLHNSSSDSLAIGNLDGT
jgi:hypothetical protein